MMCGRNGIEVNDVEFVAGCNRFGLDNPTPIITKRFSTYGNEDTVDKTIERLAKSANEQFYIDQDRFGSVFPDKTAVKAMESTIAAMKAEAKNTRDMHETAPMKRTGKKVSGVRDIKMLDRSQNAKKFESPAHVVLARGVGGIKIKDIPKNTTLKGKAIAYDKSTNIEKSLDDS